MLCIVVSRKDVASKNMAKFLMEMEKWRERDGIYVGDDRILYMIEDEHIYHNNIDREVEERGYFPSVFVFASRHSSRAKKKTLSVHPVGNYGKAEYGGFDRTLVKTAPLLMRNALELLKEKEMEGYEVCYEATHHGPFMKKPCFFIEVGSTLEEWNDMKACRAVAETILEMEEKSYEVAIGIGGGHYAPRFTDIALTKKVAFGHIAARYAVDYLDEEMITKMIDASPGCSNAYFHGEHEKIKRMLSRHLSIQ